MDGSTVRLDSGPGNTGHAVAVSGRSRERDVSHIDHLERQLRRMALDIHDSLAQSLCAAQLQVETIDSLAESRQQHAEVAALRNLLDHALEEIRNLVSELRPDAVDEIGLPAKLRSYISQVQQRTGMTVGLVVDGECPELSPSAQIAVLRIVQESLNNVRKHAHVDHADVYLRFSPEDLVCRITDGGVGFDPDAVAPGDREVGHGIRGMKERAELLEGEVDVQSTPGRGTSVTVRIPKWR
jgi:signal transduction histidine kinase